MSKKRILQVFIIGFTVIFAVSSYCRELTTNGYLLDVNWSVKRKDLVIYGDIEKGEACSKLKLAIYLGNERYPTSASLHKYLKTNHSPTSRSVFQGKSHIGSNKYKQGWYVKSATVKCLVR